MPRNGSATSSPPDTSRQATLTSEASLMCSPTTSRIHPMPFLRRHRRWPYALRLAGWPDDRNVWTGSCPCQPLSSAGQRKGHADERHLWPAFYSLIAECRPAIVFGEQVASKDGREWLAGVRADLEALGYACGAADLCAAGAGAPHIRQRFTGWPTVRASERGPRNHETAKRKLNEDGRTIHHRIEDLLTALATSTGYPNPTFLLWLMGVPGILDQNSRHR